MKASGIGPDVVLVHGLWFGPWSLKLLARRLRQAGFCPHRFRYRTTRDDLERHARDLRAFAGQWERPHFVAHSMGGLVTLTMLAAAPEHAEARVVLLGSPLRGSAVARKAGRIPGSRKLLGQAREALMKDHGPLAVANPVGMIAGTRGIGLGLLVGGVGGPGDGTVALAETRSEGLVDHLELTVTHTGMLFSRAVARETGNFLRTGAFDGSRDGTPPC